MRNGTFYTGLRAEEKTEALFARLGFVCMERRYKTKCGEIDRIFYKSEERLIVFVEVKRRKSQEEAFSCLSRHQQKRILSCAKIFLAQNEAYANMNLRFDLMAFFASTHSLTEDDFCHLENIIFDEA